MKAPELLAVVDVEGAWLAGSRPATFRTGKAEYDDVVVNGGRGGRAVRNAIEISIHAFAKIDGAAVAEAGIRNAGFGVEGYKAAIGDTEEDAGLLAIRPVSDATIDATGSARLVSCDAGVRIEFPTLAAGVGIERDNFTGCSGNEHHAIDDDRSAFDSCAVAGPSVAGVIGPCELERGDVGAVDLLEWRIAAAGFVATD